VKPEPSADHSALRENVREFAETVVRPRAADVDRDHRFPDEALAGARERNLLGILVPAAYGGAGLDHLAFVICIEELARACASTAVIVDVHTSVATEPILLFGTEEQKRAWLPRLASGDVLGAFALTEPGSGSDAAALATTARRVGDEWVLHGTKTFITNAGRAGLYIVFARSNDAPGARGVSAFLVPGDTAGLRPGRPFDKMGLNGSPTGELVLEDVRVPQAALLHEEGRGFRVAMRALDSGRIGISGQALGITAAALQEAVACTAAAGLDGGPSPAGGNGTAAGPAGAESDGPAEGNGQGAEFMLADMQTSLAAARQLTYHAASRCAAGLPFTRDAAMAKLFSTDTAMSVSGDALQLAGEAGLREQPALGRHFRDAKALQIYEGSNQVQRFVIARDLLEA
jgi:acyl-CoA dehydrogenase